MQKEKFFELLGWIGMVTAILMYVFYFQQIQQNLSGSMAFQSSKEKSSSFPVSFITLTESRNMLALSVFMAPWVVMYLRPIRGARFWKSA